MEGYTYLNKQRNITNRFGRNYSVFDRNTITIRDGSSSLTNITTTTLFNHIFVERGPRKAQADSFFRTTYA